MIYDDVSVFCFLVFKMDAIFFPNCSWYLLQCLQAYFTPQIEFYLLMHTSCDSRRRGNKQTADDKESEGDNFSDSLRFLSGVVTPFVGITFNTLHVLHLDIQLRLSKMCLLYYSSSCKLRGAVTIKGNEDRGLHLSLLMGMQAFLQRTQQDFARRKRLTFSRRTYNCISLQRIIHNYSSRSRYLTMTVFKLKQ